MRIETTVIADEKVSDIRTIVLSGTTYLMGTDNQGRQVEHVVGEGWVHTKFIFGDD